MSGTTARTAGRPDLLLPFFVLAAAAANQALFRLGALSPLWSLLLLATVAVLWLVVPHFDAATRAAPRAPLRPLGLAVGIVALLPLLLCLVIGWNREFPFSGDSYFHVGQLFRMAFWWLRPVGSEVVKVPTLDDVRRLAAHPWELAGARILLLAVIVAVTTWLYRRRPQLALGFAALTLVGWGLIEDTIFLRYPGGAYLVDLLFVGPAFALNNLELAGRLSGVAAAVAWLFVLRPWLLGRWPDLRILPVAVLLLWHKDVIHYFDSAYIEPWGVVFALLAVEHLLEAGSTGAAAACLLIGAAAAVKEPFILALPFVWLAGAPWRLPRRDLVRLTAAAIAAGVPFVLYYVARQSVDLEDMGPNRAIDLDLSGSRLVDYAAEFGHQLSVAFPGAGAVAAVAALALIPIMVWRRRDRRLALVCTVAAGLVVALLFALDLRSQRWAGYFRFQLYSLPFLVAGVLLLGESLRTRGLLVVAAAILLLQAPSAYTAVSRAAGPPTGRNFVEHYDSPLVFPMKALVAQAEAAGALAHGAPVLANLVDNTLRPLPRSPIAYGPLGELTCTCTAEHPDVMGLFVRFTNMSAFLAHERQDPGSRIGLWQKTDAERPACLAEMRRSCGHVFTRVEGGEIVGILGTQK